MIRIHENAGLHVLMDATVHDISVFTADTLSTLFVDLAAALDMKILKAPEFVEVPVDPDVLRISLETGAFADEGGITGFCIINKSHMSLHAWPLQETFSADVFSCCDFDPELALNLIRERLGVKAENSHIIHRKRPVIKQPIYEFMSS